jgi:predicted nucleotidyltransferase
MIIYEEVLREFQRQKVKYVLVGGIAFNLLGGYRNTLDMDILVEMSDKNLFKIVNILKKAGYHVKQPVDPIMIADKKTRRDWIKNKNMKAFNFYKGERSYEEVDIIIDSPVNFENAISDALEARAGGLALKVISLKNFIKMKKASGRDKDLRDIAALKLARGMK